MALPFIRGQTSTNMRSGFSSCFVFSTQTIPMKSPIKNRGLATEHMGSPQPFWTSNYFLYRYLRKVHKCTYY